MANINWNKVEQSFNNINPLKYYNDNFQQNCHKIGPLRVSREKIVYQFLNDKNFLLLTWVNYGYFFKNIPVQLPKWSPLYVLSNCMKSDSKNHLINNYYFTLVLNDFLTTDYVDLMLKLKHWVKLEYWVKLSKRGVRNELGASRLEISIK